MERAEQKHWESGEAMDGGQIMVPCIPPATGTGSGLQIPQTHQHRAIHSSSGNTSKINLWGPQMKGAQA